MLTLVLAVVQRTAYRQQWRPLCWSKKVCTRVYRYKLHDKNTKHGPNKIIQNTMKI